MSGIRVTIPPSPRGVATRLGLTSWVNRKAFPAQAYFLSINNARRSLKSVGSSEDDCESIVAMMAIILKRDEAFIDYVLDTCEQDVADDDNWQAHFEAFAWILLQRYYRDIASNDWDPDD